VKIFQYDFTHNEMRKMMAAKKALRFKVGDWIVHNLYGVGEVVEIADKTSDGQQQTFFKVCTARFEYWIPVEKADADHIKPVRSKREFTDAIQIISDSPEPMSELYNNSKRLINERWLDGSLPSRAALLRDLHGRNHRKALSYDEKETFRKIENFFIDEWIISNPSLTRSMAKQKLTEALELSTQKGKLESSNVS
jgi:RNA polymerase-interacting CarD/CdnL/TRCF family regulator